MPLYFYKDENIFYYCFELNNKRKAKLLKKFL